MTGRRGLRGALLVLGAVLLLRLGLASQLPLIDDEAYYWTWSRKLAGGYFDHPPAIAWLIAPGVALLGKGSLGVRLLPIVFGVLAVALLARRSQDPLRLVLLTLGMPLFALGGLLATPDLPLVFGWALALSGAMGRNYVLAGVGVGLASLGKYTGWGLWPLFLLAAPRDGLRMLPGIGATLALLAPNLIWNAQHDWVSVAFQLGHGLDRPPGGAGAFFGAQLGLAGPLLAILGFVWAAPRALAIARDPLARGPSVSHRERVLWWTGMPVVLFFTLAATRGSGEANWAAPAWLSVAVALADAQGRMARASWIAAGVGLALSGLVLVHLVHPLAPLKNDPIARLGEGRDLAQSVQAWGVEPVYTVRYQEAAILSYHANLEAYALPGVDRLDQYDLWPIRWSEHAMFVRPYRSGEATHADRFCADRKGPSVVTEAGPRGSPKRWQVYEVFDCAAEAP